MIHRSAITTLMTVLIGLSAVGAGPAAARNGFRFVWTPRGDDARFVSDGLKLYSIARHMRNHANVNQRGTDNSAVIAQSSTGNEAAVFQRGRGHAATASQDGNYNALGIFQFGRNTSTTVSQRGNGNAGLVFEGGW